MSNRKKKGVFSEEIIVVTIGIAIVYWIIDSIFWVFARVDIGFFGHIFRPDLGEMGARIIVVCLFAIFGSHTHQMIKKYKNAQKEIEQLKTANEQLTQEISALKNV
ncbi:hypothetical protein ACFL2E_04030 [Thermodesulfobacteriota bacterium]